MQMDCSVGELLPDNELMEVDSIDHHGNKSKDNEIMEVARIRNENKRSIDEEQLDLYRVKREKNPKVYPGRCFPRKIIQQNPYQLQTRSVVNDEEEMKNHQMMIYQWYEMLTTDGPNIYDDVSEQIALIPPDIKAEVDEFVKLHKSLEELSNRSSNEPSEVYRKIREEWANLYKRSTEVENLKTKVEKELHILLDDVTKNIRYIRNVVILMNKRKRRKKPFRN